MFASRLSLFTRVLLAAALSLPVPSFAAERAAVTGAGDAPDRLCLGDVRSQQDILDAIQNCKSDQLNELRLKIGQLKAAYNETQTQIAKVEAEIDGLSTVGPSVAKIAVPTLAGIGLTMYLRDLGVDAEVHSYMRDDSVAAKKYRSIIRRYDAAAGAVLTATIVSAAIAAYVLAGEVAYDRDTLIAKTNELPLLKARLGELTLELGRREAIVASLIRKQNRQPKRAQN